MQIKFIKGSMGGFEAFVDGVRQEIKGIALDREALLLKILAEQGIEVAQETVWYTKGKREIAHTSNMSKETIWTEG